MVFASAYSWLTRCLLLLPLIGPVHAADQSQGCLKLVFNRYCLGGNFEELVRQLPAPVGQVAEKNRKAAIYLDSFDQVYVLAFRDRVYKVVREYRPSTQLHFDELSALLSEKYGAPAEHSVYPPYADSRAARIVAIRRGEGRAVHTWGSGQGWSVELSWTREMGLALSYIDDALDAERRNVMEAGL